MVQRRGVASLVFLVGARGSSTNVGIAGSRIAAAASSSSTTDRESSLLLRRRPFSGPDDDASNEVRNDAAVDVSRDVSPCDDDDDDDAGGGRPFAADVAAALASGRRRSLNRAAARKRRRRRRKKPATQPAAAGALTIVLPSGAGQTTADADDAGPFSDPPSHFPSVAPSDGVAVAPSFRPSTSSTPTETETPSERPTNLPTTLPTDAPTSFPTDVPTSRPTDVPTSAPMRIRRKSNGSRCASGVECSSDSCRSGRCAQGTKGTGVTCDANEQCSSNVCRDSSSSGEEGGACFASDRCVPIKHDGSPFDSSKINLVFVGSGFSSASRLRSKSIESFRRFETYDMFDRTNDRYNAFYVDDVSNGMSFCNYGCAGIDRLLCCDIGTARKLAGKCFHGGATLQTIVIHDDDKYGGAGYSSANLATTSTHRSAALVAVHEIGHSLFELADEYTYGSGTDRSSNCDVAGCPKWSDLSDSHGVGCVPGQCKGGSYYVGQKSFMTSLSLPVGHVNLRLSCCTYMALTGGVPRYCDTYDRTNALRAFCRKSQQGYSVRSVSPGTAAAGGGGSWHAVKYVRVRRPLLLTLVLDDRGESYVETAREAVGSPGLYPSSEVDGDYPDLDAARASGSRDVVRVVVRFSSGGGDERALFFDRRAPVLPPPVEDDPDSGVATADADGDEASAIVADEPTLAVIADALEIVVDTTDEGVVVVAEIVSTNP